MKKSIFYLMVFVLIAIGVMTLFLTTSILMNWFGVRAAEGNCVGFVVWSNLACAILYLFAAYGLFKRKKWTFKLLATAAVVLIVAYVGLFWHINTGGLYEVKTIGAMAFRLTVTMVFAVLAFFTINKRRGARAEQ